MAWPKQHVIIYRLAIKKTHFQRKIIVLFRRQEKRASDRVLCRECDENRHLTR
jgi:hypothetical protein